ncbi:MAG: transglutaminase-like domain-containing protein [Rickettsiales bacterium]|nr:transglutaminase-like domain-containing protein [Rickettsiales bacterium]
MKKVFSFFNCLFFLLIITTSVFASNTKINIWQEEVKLTEAGRKGRVAFILQVVNLPNNSYITDYQFLTISKAIVKYSKVLVDDKVVNYTQNNGLLKIKLNQPKKNQESIKISYDYEEKYTSLQPELRNEIIYVPNFAVGANYQVLLRFDKNYELLNINSNSKKVYDDKGSALLFQGTVPSSGVLERIKLTSNDVKWQAKVLNIVNVNNLKGMLNVETPILFRDGWQRVEKQELVASHDSIDKGFNDKSIFFKFNLNENDKKIIVKNVAIIATGKKNRVSFKRNPLQYKEFSREEQLLVSQLIARAQNEEKYKNLPLYAQLTMFVNDYIKYDHSYFKKNLPLRQIITNRAGVCIEYATLLNAMAKVAGIPAIIVNGLAIGEKDKFEPHAWNALYVDNRWIFVDPTWGLDSGEVSSGHIYLNDNGFNDIEVKFSSETSAKVSSDFEFEVHKIL